MSSSLGEPKNPTNNDCQQSLKYNEGVLTNMCYFLIFLGSCSKQKSAVIGKIVDEH